MEHQTRNTPEMADIGRLHLTGVPKICMIHSMWNSIVYGTPTQPAIRPSASEMVSRESLIPLLADRLPDSWRVEMVEGGRLRVGPDALVIITPPEGSSTTLAVEAKYPLPRAVAQQAALQLRNVFDGPGLVVSPYIPPGSREALESAGVGYADLTGNLYLRIDAPALFLRDRGLDVDPWREPLVVTSLKGRGAAKAVRALCDFLPPYGIRELAERSGAPIASLSRTVGYLTREGLVSRSEAGGVTEVDWKGLIRAWIRDYSVLKSNRVTRYLEPRGPQAILSRFQNRDMTLRYAITGSLAAQEYAPYAPAALAMIYTQKPAELAQGFRLRKTDRGANVFLLEPPDLAPFRRSSRRERAVRFAAVSQVAADLLTSPGRSPEEAEELIRWMGSNEEKWRKSIQ